MYIIGMKDARGRITVGTTPAVHPSPTTAQSAAEEVAKASPGTEYFVFKAVSSVLVHAEYKTNVEELK